MEAEELTQIIRNACPGAGACGGMYTANTMSSSIEAMGLSLPFSSSNPATTEQKKQDCIDAAAAIYNLLQLYLTPRHIVPRSSLSNALVVFMSLEFGRAHFLTPVTHAPLVCLLLLDLFTYLLFYC